MEIGPIRNQNLIFSPLPQEQSNSRQHLVGGEEAKAKLENAHRLDDCFGGCSIYIPSAAPAFNCHLGDGGRGCGVPLVPTVGPASPERESEQPQSAINVNAEHPNYGRLGLEMQPEGRGRKEGNEVVASSELKHCISNEGQVPTAGPPPLMCGDLISLRN